MEGVQEILDQLYRKVLLGATLEDDVHGYIFYLNPDLSEQDGCTIFSAPQGNVSGMLHGLAGQHGPSSCEVATLPNAQECSKMTRAWEVKVLQLTVIDMLLRRVLYAEMETHAEDGYRELADGLLQSVELDSKLIRMLQNSDKLLSHMAAKCLASLLYFQLREKKTLKNHLLDSDMLALAEALLHAVHLGLWKALAVPGTPSCFGGDEVQPGCRLRAGPDHVTLRAASLITVKSLEIKFQNCTSAAEMKEPHLQPSLQLHNPCEWLSRVFIEQDDDMLEAAKASLGIHLRLTR
ncbi:Protein Lines homolog 1 [Apodemus speciosus]|uniref:Protein Lines homolog 1 n=1 Tax=Apodemus speciosus TaxID=105296 RepID=A0ABQ0EZG9_APOSI